MRDDREEVLYFLCLLFSADLGPASEAECDSPGQMPCSRDWSLSSASVANVGERNWRQK